MNWGYKILMVYAVFVSGILFMVFRSSATKVDLVTTDYYTEELKYQQTIDAVKRTGQLAGTTTSVASGDSLIIALPPAMVGRQVTGSLLLYCIADKDKDVQQTFTTNKGSVLMQLPPNNKGLHDVKVSWTSDGQTYYHEQKIFLQ